MFFFYMVLPWIDSMWFYAYTNAEVNRLKSEGMWSWFPRRGLAVWVRISDLSPHVSMNVAQNDCSTYTIYTRIFIWSIIEVSLTHYLTYYEDDWTWMKRMEFPISLRQKWWSSAISTDASEDWLDKQEPAERCDPGQEMCGIPPFSRMYIGFASHEIIHK